MRRLSGAIGTAAIQCGVNITLTFSPEVLLVHKSDGTRFSFPEQKDCPHQLHHHHYRHHRYHRAEPLDSHTEVSFSQGAFRSTVQSSLVCTNTQSVRSGGQKHSQNTLMHEDVSSNHLSNSPGSLSVSPSFHSPHKLSLILFYTV